MILKDGSDYQPDGQATTMLERAYPGINIEIEMAKMDMWCYANPGKRKTCNGALRFINSWLSRAKPSAVTVSTRSTTLEQDLTDTSWA